MIPKLLRSIIVVCGFLTVTPSFANQEAQSNSSISVGFAPLYSSYSLSGKGLTFKSKTSYGDMKFIDGKLAQSDRSAIRFRARHQNVLFKDLEQVTPDEVRVIRNHFNLFTERQISESSSVGFGLYMDQRITRDTLPAQLVTRTQQTGIAISGGKSLDLSEDLTNENFIEFEMPLVFRELDSSTGSYNTAYNIEARSGLVYSSNSWQQWSLGLALRQTKIFFQGIGERGAKNATDTQLDYWFPIEFRVRF